VAVQGGILKEEGGETSPEGPGNCLIQNIFLPPSRSGVQLGKKGKVICYAMRICFNTRRGEGEKEKNKGGDRCLFVWVGLQKHGGIVIKKSKMKT